MNITIKSCISGITLASGLLGCGGEVSIAPADTELVELLAGYSAIADGRGGVNYEAVAITPAMKLDKSASLASFKTTLYPRLVADGCATCHSSQTQGQAPLIADDSMALAHEYALTSVNFKEPAASRLVGRLEIDRHHCPGDSCRDAAEAMLAAVRAWIATIAPMLPETPRGIPADKTITEAEILACIEADKASLAAEERPFMVYTSLHELHNAGLSADALNIVRAGLSKALNSVARWAPEIVNPTDVTGTGTVYRFDIRDYWGYNQGVEQLLFGGSDDDLAFANGKRDYRGELVDNLVAQQRYDFTGVTSADPAHALRIWQRVLHGNVEGGSTTGTLPANIEGFKGERRENAAGEYVAAEDLVWVEAAQLIYTLTRPDVYNAIMMNPMQAQELEQNLEVDNSRGVDTYDYIVTFDANTVDSRLMWRARRADGGWYWKTFGVFTGVGVSGPGHNIFDIYADPEGKDIRFPFWANPLPRFVDPADADAEDNNFSFVATLAQTVDFDIANFTHPETPGCDNQSGAVPGFGFCKHYTGTGGMQQSESHALYSLPNGLQGYYLAGGGNQRRVSSFADVERDPRRLRAAGDDIAYITGFSYSWPDTDSPPFQRASEPRLIVGSSCIGCHADGLKRASNDLRHWLEHDPARLPRGEYGVDGWIDDAGTVARVKELYPPREVTKRLIEQDRQAFLAAMGKIKQAMILGEDKNLYVEPVIWAVEYVQDEMYGYPNVSDN